MVPSENYEIFFKVLYNVSSAVAINESSDPGISCDILSPFNRWKVSTNELLVGLQAVTSFLNSTNTSSMNFKIVGWSIPNSACNLLLAASTQRLVLSSPLSVLSYTDHVSGGRKQCVATTLVTACSSSSSIIFILYSI